MPIEIEPTVRGLMAGCVCATGLTIGPADGALTDACKGIVESVQREGTAGGDARREAVRRMLRAGGFRPAGRNKPAQEYLLRTVLESGGLPAIFNAVDWLNAISLHSGLPISLLSSVKVGLSALVRYGAAEERFVFNRTGQELELAGLICVCSRTDTESRPLGTPIKDSMEGKICEDDRDVLAIIYAARDAVSRDELTQWCEKLASGFQRYCGATSSDCTIVESALGGISS